MTIAFSHSAANDLASIWEWNAETYSEEHADKYVRFVLTEISSLTQKPFQGVVLRDRNEIRRLLVRKGKKGHGHLAFYRLSAEEIEVIRVLHTAQDWPEIIERYLG